MSDEHSQRPFRAKDMPQRHAPSASGSGTSSGSDPLAELARLIGQNDPFGEFGVKSAPTPSDAMQRRADQQRPHPQAQMPAAQAHVPTQSYRSAQNYRAAENYGRTEAHGAEDYGRQTYGNAPPPSAYDNDPNGGDADPANYEYGDHDANEGGFDPDGSGYYDEAKPLRRRSGVLAVAAVFTLAVIGTAGALGYRALFGREISGPPPIIKADPRPSKIVPDKKETASAKLINDRVGSGDEKLVPREEQPIEAKAAESFPAAAQAAPGVASAQTPPSRGLTAGAMPPAIGGGVIGGEPKKIHTIVIHPDQTAMAGPPASLPSAPPQQPSANLLPDAPAKPPASVARTPPASASEPAPPRHQAPRTAHAARTVHPANAPLSLDPNAGTGTKMANVVAAPAPIAPRAAPSSSGKYAVQLSSRRSQSEAETAFRGLKAKFPSQLGSRQSIIRKVDLGKKGVYYRAMVGPFATSDEANQLCSKLKAAGGSCFVQRI